MIDDPFRPNALLDDLMSNALRNSLMSPAPTLGNALLGADLAYRRRRDWNARFAHWEKPASVSEEGTIERAEANVLSAIGDNRLLSQMGVKIARQGSYHNNTNVRTEADIDLHAQHRALKVDYSPITVREIADRSLGFSSTGQSLPEVFAQLRTELINDLSRKFGKANVDASGKKAIRIKGITGSRAEIDVVPAVGYNYVAWDSTFNRYLTCEGVAILSTEGKWTINYQSNTCAMVRISAIRQSYVSRK